MSYKYRCVVRNVFIFGERNDIHTDDSVNEAGQRTARRTRGRHESYWRWTYRRHAGHPSRASPHEKRRVVAVRDFGAIGSSRSLSSPTPTNIYTCIYNIYNIHT